MAKKKQRVADDEEFDFDFEEVEESDEIEEEEIERKVPMLTTVDDIELPSAWGQSATNIEEVRKARQTMNLKHGMFANVPMVCKGGACPLNAVCPIALSKRPLLKRCPIEIANIIELYDRYCTALQIGPEDFLDQTQVKDLVDVEIKLMRAAGQLAIAGDFIEDVAAFPMGEGKDAQIVTTPQLHKATEYEKQLSERKRKILSDLMATRKSSGEGQNLSDPSSFASDLMRRAMKAQAMVVDMQTETISVNSDTGEEDE